MIKKYLKEESGKQSLMRLIAYIMTITIVVISLGQVTVQIITAIKENTIYNPNWYGIATMFLMTVLGKAGQKYLEKK